jgi:hypothetical protein
MLKPVNKEKNPGLAKLPEKVRNRMGFAKKGKMTYAKSGTMSTKDDDKRDIRKTESMIGASKSSKREKGKMLKAKKGVLAKKDYKLGFKMQGDYKGKDVLGKAKEFVSTATKQNKGTVQKFQTLLQRFTPEEAKKMMDDPKRKERLKKLMRERNKQKSDNQVDKKFLGGEMKSTKGFGAARTSGMGLQDESLPAGKTLDYYKDIM